MMNQTNIDRDPSEGRHPKNFRAQRIDQLDTQAESALWDIDREAQEFEAREGYNLMVRFGMEVQA